MSSGRQTSLPDGEFFMLKDRRDESNLLSGRTIRVPGTEDSELYDQHDNDKERSKELSMARLQRLRELYPNPDPAHQPHSLFDDRRFRFDASLLSKVSYFYGPPPQQEINYDFLTDFAREPIVGRDGKLSEAAGSYRFVSEKWKDAIEGLEPGVHEFFSHEVEFSGYTMYGHFIFRDCPEMEFADLERSGPGAVQKVRSGPNQGKLTTKYDPVGLAAKGEMVAGRHWIRHAGVHWPFVSRALALKLLPLLPRVLETPEPFIFRPVLLV